jgi:BTB/POZ domain
MTDPRSPEAYDVKFVVGPEEYIVQANKFVLASSSDVFHRMFYSDFPSESEISITDIDAEAFELMIASIYGQDVILTKGNIAEVYYAAEKYGLLFLRRVCKTLIVNSIDSANSLAQLITYQHYNDAEINKKCLSFILDNPLKYFEKPEFVEAPADVVRTIFKPPSINCSAQDVREALSKWMIKQNGQLTYSNRTEWFKAVENQLQITREELEMKTMRQHLFQLFKHSFYRISDCEISFNLVETHVYLHGFGLLMGLVQHETFSVEISTDKGFSRDLGKITVEKKGSKNVVSIQDVFFEKMPIYHGRIKVKLNFDTASDRPHKQGEYVSHLILSKIR